VAQRFDRWTSDLEQLTQSGTLNADEQRCLEHFLTVTQSQRPRLLHCYDVEGLPRTNNTMEGYIRSLKTRYRRVSGRKNWNSYLLRYGRSVAYYEYFSRAGGGEAEMRKLLEGMEAQLRRKVRQSDRFEQEVQLKRYR